MARTSQYRSLMPTIPLRLGIALVVGVLAAFIPLGSGSQPVTHGLLGFVAAGLAFAVPLLAHIMSHDASSTRLKVQGRDGDVAWHDLVVIIVGLASLCGVGTLLIGSSAKGTAQVVDALVGFATVVVGWFCVHTVYALRYARFYYASPEPPIDFKQKDDPTFSDFAYFSFNLGMAYQISDNDLRASAIRRIVLWHCMLGYLYGTTIIAASINLIAGIGGKSG